MKLDGCFFTAFTAREVIVLCDDFFPSQIRFPEVFDKENYGLKVDVYGLGCVLYELWY